MNKTAWIIFSAATIGILTLLVFISGSNRLDVSQIDTNLVQPASNQNGNIADHTFGNVDSKVTLIEYGDFQCPGCAQQHIVTKELVEKYSDQVNFVFRNFPLTSAHPNAKAAAGAVEAAGIQGKYWDMYNLVYESQSSWKNLSGGERTQFFEDYASQLELNIDQFKADINGSNSNVSISSKINFDLALGKKSGVDATPTFYLNGEKLPAEIWGEKDKFEAAIVEKLKAAEIELP